VRHCSFLHFEAKVSIQTVVVRITADRFSENQDELLLIEISNPYIKKLGSPKSLLFSWWCRELGTVLNRELDLESITYDVA
jgi:hypothetical protein